MTQYDFTPLGLDAMKIPTYTPNRLLDIMQERFGYRSDAKLARAIGVTPVMMSKIRNKKVGVSNTVLLAMHERLGVPIAELKHLAGIPPYKPKGVS